MSFIRSIFQYINYYINNNQNTNIEKKEKYEYEFNFKKYEGNYSIYL
jgi:hypothetical protein